MPKNAKPNPSSPVKTFSELPISAVLKENLQRKGFVTPRPIQAQALGPALAGRDILGTAQTGTGKTLAFIIPIVERLSQERGKGIEALVILPTRELAMQVLDTLQSIDKGIYIPSVLVVGGLSEGKQLREIRKGARVVIATPGRLDDYIQRNLVNLKSVKILVLDEADHMVDMGFLPQMKNIMQSVGEGHQTMAFAATLDREVKHLVHDYLHDPLRVEVGSTIRAVDSVTLLIYEVAHTQKYALLTHLLDKESGTFLVFARTRHGANNLARKLTRQGFSASALHGDKTQAQRTKALKGFKSGAHRILVATDVAARGIHVDSIAHVINYDLPDVAETFIHRVGRTGRDVETGVATTFVMPDQVKEIKTIERILGAQIERLPLPSHLPPATASAPSRPSRPSRPSSPRSKNPRSRRGGPREGTRKSKPRGSSRNSGRRGRR